MWGVPGRGSAAMSLVGKRGVGRPINVRCVQLFVKEIYECGDKRQFETVTLGSEAPP